MIDDVVLAIDPGPERSAWIRLRSGRVMDFAIQTNAEILDELRDGWIAGTIVVEQIESFGMAVGREVFGTVFWAGRFVEAWETGARDRDPEHRRVVMMPRRAVKLALCGSMKAKDSNIRQALIDRFGGDSVAVGRKATPGPLYGISKDVWSALAIAVTHVEQREGIAA